MELKAKGSEAWFIATHLSPRCCVSAQQEGTFPFHRPPWSRGILEGIVDQGDTHVAHTSLSCPTKTHLK